MKGVSVPGRHRVSGHARQGRRSGKPGRLVIPALQALGVGVSSPDPAGKTRFWNRQAAETLFDLPA